MQRSSLVTHEQIIFYLFCNFFYSRGLRCETHDLFFSLYMFCSFFRVFFCYFVFSYFFLTCNINKLRLTFKRDRLVTIICRHHIFVILICYYCLVPCMFSYSPLTLDRIYIYDFVLFHIYTIKMEECGGIVYMMDWAGNKVPPTASINIFLGCFG